VASKEVVSRVLLPAPQDGAQDIDPDEIAEDQRQSGKRQPKRFHGGYLFFIGKLSAAIFVYPEGEGCSSPRETVMFEGLFQPMHLVVVLAIALLVFGPKKLPELGRGLGESIRGFKDALNGGAEASQAQASTPKAESPKPPVAPPGT